MKFLVRITLFALLSIQLAQAETIGGRVVPIANGNTITALTPEPDQVLIRLSETDAPEYFQDFGGRVVSIADGDTITVLTPEKNQVRIRLSEIDAPEYFQDFGQASTELLSSLVFGKDVLVHPEGLDKYGS